VWLRSGFGYNKPVCVEHLLSRRGHRYISKRVHCVSEWNGKWTYCFLVHISDACIMEWYSHNTSEWIWGNGRRELPWISNNYWFQDKLRCSNNVPFRSFTSTPFIRHIRYYYTQFSCWLWDDEFRYKHIESITSRATNRFRSRYK
jgi:hypothetical protein